MRKITNNRTSGGKELKYALLSVAGILLFFIIWQSLIALGVLDGASISKPTDILRLFIQKFTDPRPDGAVIQRHIFASLQTAMLGFALGVVVGIPLGLFMGWYRSVNRFVTPVFELVRPIPPLAWIPLTILWIGIGVKARVFIIFMSSFIPCVINAYSGIKQTSPVLINVAKTCGTSNFRIFLHVGVPSALPLIFTGIQNALGMAWTTLVAAEMLASSEGLGYMIFYARQFGRIDVIMLGMLVIGLLGVILSALLNWLESHVLKWRVSGSEK